MDGQTDSHAYIDIITPLFIPSKSDGWYKGPKKVPFRHKTSTQLTVLFSDNYKSSLIASVNFKPGKWYDSGFTKL